MFRCRITLLALVLIAPASAGQTLPSDPFTQARRIEEELSTLNDWPFGREAYKIEVQLTQLTQSQTELRVRLEDIQRTDEYKQFARKKRELQGKLQDAMDAQKTAIASAARTIYSDRHREIAARGEPPVPQGRALKFDLLSFPRLDGSTSTHPLAVIIASRLLGVSFEWQYPLPQASIWPATESTYASPYWVLDAQLYNPAPEVKLAASRVEARGETEPEKRTALMINHVLAKNSNTHDSYQNLINGQCDLIFVARAMSKDESALARDKHVEIDTVPIAQDALVFLVHTGNPIRTREQLTSIYNQKAENWQDIGGPNRSIETLWREPNSGSRELFDAFNILAGEPPPANVRQLYTLSMSGPYNALTVEPNAIGYSVYYYDQYMAMSPYTRRLAIDGIEPTPDTFASGKYPFVAPVFAVFRKSEPESSGARRLVQWLVSPEGQAVVRQAGYIQAKTQ